MTETLRGNNLLKPNRAPSQNIRRKNSNETNSSYGRKFSYNKVIYIRFDIQISPVVLRASPASTPVECR